MGALGARRAVHDGLGRMGFASADLPCDRGKAGWGMPVQVLANEFLATVLGVRQQTPNLASR